MHDSKDTTERKNVWERMQERVRRKQATFAAEQERLTTGSQDDDPLALIMRLCGRRDSRE